jgi:hypothetical protein
VIILHCTQQWVSSPTTPYFHNHAFLTVFLFLSFLGIWNIVLGFFLFAFPRVFGWGWVLVQMLLECLITLFCNTFFLIFLHIFIFIVLYFSYWFVGLWRGSKDPYMLYFMQSYSLTLCLWFLLFQWCLLRKRRFWS